LVGQLLEEGLDLLRLRRNLSGLDDVAVLVAERDGDLPGVLVDPQIQHRWFSCWVAGLKVSDFTVPTRRGNRFISTTLLFHRSHSAQQRGGIWSGKRPMLTRFKSSRPD